MEDNVTKEQYETALMQYRACIKILSAYKKQQPQPETSHRKAKKPRKINLPKGVYPTRNSSKYDYCSKVYFNGKTYSLGAYTFIDDAKEVYEAVTTLIIESETKINITNIDALVNEIREIRGYEPIKRIVS